MVDFSDVLRLTRAGRLREATASIGQILRRKMSRQPAAEPRRPAVAPPAGSVHGYPSPLPPQRSPDTTEDVEGGQFIAGRYTSEPGSRAYKLYIPSGYAGADALPLIVMLHGCKQNPDDFAAGTHMNELAEKHPVLVLYPGQARSANVAGCWNWFRDSDQQRGSGEPAVLAGMTRDVMARYRVDSRRVYIAGLSAGGAMAAVMAKTYPELFAAVGIHSGLPYGAAHDATTAFAAMHGVAAVPRAPSRPSHPGDPDRFTPMIVFHGDEDHTVHPENGLQITREELERLAERSPEQARSLQRTEEKNQSAGGRSYTRCRYVNGGSTLIEQWTVHGSGHAWSGGSASGSFTDPAGPDASAAMLEFFLGQPGQPH